MLEVITLKTMKEIKIISNPIRMRVLKNYYAYGKPATVKQMAQYMNEVPANIHYHVKKLIEINLLELEHTESINGITAKFYQPTAKHIKIEDESNDMYNKFLDGTEILFANVFDDAKKDFIESVRSKKSKSEDDEGLLLQSNLYLTKAQAEDIYQYILQTVEHNKTEVNDKEKYVFFAALNKVSQGEK